MEQKLNFNTLNILLRDIMNLRNHGEVVEQKTTEQNNYNGSYFIVKLNEKEFGKDLYIRVDDSTNSYGDEYTITGIQFVKPTKVVVTDFVTL